MSSIHKIRMRAYLIHQKKKRNEDLFKVKKSSEPLDLSNTTSDRGIDLERKSKWYNLTK